MRMVTVLPTANSFGTADDHVKAIWDGVPVGPASGVSVALAPSTDATLNRPSVTWATK